MTAHEWIGKPPDELLREYLDGEHGEPSAEVVSIIRAELEAAIRKETP